MPPPRSLPRALPQGWREDLDGRDFETACGIAQAAERLGFDSIWLYDHLQTRDGDPDRVLECWSTLAALARETTRVQLGQLVTGVGYRNPGLLAQMASTVDAASGGRVVVGVGAGWDEREWRDFGYGEEPAADRRTARAARGRAARAAAAARRPADPRRRRRRAGAPPARRPLRRRLQPHRLVRSRVLPAQARRAAATLRRRGPGLRHDRAHRVVHAGSRAASSIRSRSASPKPVVS